MITLTTIRVCIITFHVAQPVIKLKCKKATVEFGDLMSQAEEVARDKLFFEREVAEMRAESATLNKEALSAVKPSEKKKELEKEVYDMAKTSVKVQESLYEDTADLYFSHCELSTFAFISLFFD